MTHPFIINIGSNLIIVLVSILNYMFITKYVIFYVFLIYLPLTSDLFVFQSQYNPVETGIDHSPYIYHDIIITGIDVQIR